MEANRIQDKLVRVWNPPNPYLSEHREWIDLPPPAALEIYEDNTSQIISENDSPDLSFRYSVNPYRGCLHACSYCYARPTHEYFGWGAGTDFERKIVVKPNAARLLEEVFAKRSWKGDWVLFSGVTDCYQPLEAAWKLTRRCLEVCLKYRNPVAIVTKSALIRRDLDLLQDLKRLAKVRVFLSIPFLDEAIARCMEPQAPAIHRRFETMECLSQAGIPVGIGVAPIVPGLNDRDIPGLLKWARRCGARYAFKTLLRLPAHVRDVFLFRITNDLPLHADHIIKRIRDVRQGKWYDPRFGFRQTGSGPYWQAIEQLWTVWVRRLGFQEMEDDEVPSTFRRPIDSDTGQMRFAWEAEPAVL
jgi:DNA repair photolyase